MPSGWPLCCVGHLVQALEFCALTLCSVKWHDGCLVVRLDVLALVGVGVFHPCLYPVEQCCGMSVEWVSHDVFALVVMYSCLCPMEGHAYCMKFVVWGKTGHACIGWCRVAGWC